MTLDVAAMRQHVTTPLEDDALGRLIAAAYEAIADRIGADTSRGELLHGVGDLLMLSRRAVSVESITEVHGTFTLQLDEDDYELRPGGRTLRRLVTGTNPSYRWRWRNDVRYTPQVGDSDRDRVAVDLVKLEADYQPGLTGERTGDHQITIAANSVFNYAIERDAILNTLYGPPLVLL